MKTTYSAMINTPETSRGIFDFVLTTFGVIFTAAWTGADLQTFFIALGGSVCGAAALGYFRSERNKVDTAFKILTSVVGGFVLGAVAEEYLQLQSWRYQLGVYFVSSMTSIAIFRTLLNMTEKNAPEVLQVWLQRLLGLRTKDELEQRRNEFSILEKTTDNGTDTKNT